MAVLGCLGKALMGRRVPAQLWPTLMVAGVVEAVMELRVLPAVLVVMEVRMVAVEVMVAPAVVMAAAQSVSCGPVILVHSHQLAQARLNF